MFADPRDPSPPAWICSASDGHPTVWHPGVHVVPFGDDREHLFNARCWCEPTQVQVIEYPTCDQARPIIGGDWQHHAADGRPLAPHRQAILDAARAHGPEVIPWGPR